MAQAKAVQAFESGGRLTKDQPQEARVSAFELDGKLFRTEEDAYRAKAVAALNDLLRANGPLPVAIPRLLANPRAVAAILVEYADAIGE